MAERGENRYATEDTVLTVVRKMIGRPLGEIM